MASEEDGCGDVAKDDARKAAGQREALRAQDLANARSHLNIFFSLVDEDDKVFDSNPKRKWSLARILNVSKHAITPPKNPNVTVSMKGLRNLFRHPSIDRTSFDTAKYLLNLEIVCKDCHKANSKAGVLDCNPTSLKKHLNTDGHTKNAARIAVAGSSGSIAGKKRPLRQLDLVQAGLDHLSTDEQRAAALMWSTASLAAGGAGSHPIPPSMIGKTMSQTVLRLVSHMKSGFAGDNHTRTVILPKSVEMIKRHQLATLESGDNDYFSLGVDSGASWGLCPYIKILPITLMSPRFGEMVVDVPMLPLHETGEIQSKIINGWFEKNKIAKWRLKWLAVDNNELNVLTVKLLCSEYGFKVHLARCVDHSLSLVFCAFFQPFEDEFDICKILSAARAFLRSGGSQSRAAAIGEFGITISRLDSAPTRWMGRYEAVKYIMDKQSARELKFARELLTSSAAWGDKSATAALEEPDISRARWEVLAEALESFGKDADDNTRTRQVPEVRGQCGVSRCCARRSLTSLSIRISSFILLISDEAGQVAGSLRRH